jgi:integrase
LAGGAAEDRAAAGDRRGRAVSRCRDEQALVLNRVAKSVIDGARSEHEKFVFVYRKRPIDTMNNTGWQIAHKRVGLLDVRVHDLKHTFGRRLRAAGVRSRTETICLVIVRSHHALLGGRSWRI